MRTSLQNIELVEKYLCGELNAQEKFDLEKALLNDTDLQQQLALQKDIMRTVQRIGMKKEIQKVARFNKLVKLSKWLAGGLIATAIIIASILLFSKEEKKNNAPQQEKTETLENKSVEAQTTPNSVIAKAITTPKNVLPLFIEPTVKGEEPKVSDCFNFYGLKTWVQPDVQSYNVNPKEGATIEGKEGTLIIIPSNAFINDNNEIVNDNVQFELVEALTLEDIVLYNSGTTSNGKLLESGGMLHINATCNNQQVKINPARPLYIEVPTNEVKKDMMVFEGKTQENGKLNWENPKSLKKYLVHVPLNDLDFLPDGFAAKVESFMPYKGYTKATKKLVDSLYYNLDSERYLGKVALLKRQNSGYKSKRDTLKYGNIQVLTEAEAALNDSKNSTHCGINPSSIQTIKTKEYNNSFVATKEFEDRIAALHKLENGDEMLSIYIEHLKDDLCISDSIVASKLYGNDQIIFEDFAMQKCTNVKDAQIYQEQLSAYYIKKRNERIAAQNELAAILKNKKTNELQAITKGAQNINTVSLANSLAKSTVATGNVYSFQWSKFGWANIDAYLHLLSKGVYNVNMKVNNGVGTTEVYQWLNSINTLTPLQLSNGNCTALFPKENTMEARRMENTYCLAISKNGDSYQWFEKRYNPYQTEQVIIEMKNLSISEIKERLRAFSPGNDLTQRIQEVEQMALLQIKLQQEAAENLKKLEQLKKEREAAIALENQRMEELRKIAFRCYECVTPKKLEQPKNIIDMQQKLGEH